MSFDRKAMTDAEFERALLASADADAPPHDTGAAWARFASMTGLTASAPPAAVEEPRSEVVPHAARRGAASLKWLLVGAIGGGLVTAALLRQVQRPPSDRPDSVASVIARAATGDGAVCAPVPAPSPAVVVLRGPVQPGRHTAHGASRRHARVSAPSEIGKDLEEPVEKASSTLAAEVARLDAARAALAGGDYDQVVRLVEQYHWDFPGGGLAPDADVVALEAVAAKHDRAEVSRRAALFLARYPGDPHAARVMWLGAH